MPQIRVWQIGDKDTRLVPTSETVDRLKSQLESRKPGEDLDIVWGPDLKVQVIETKD